MIYTNHTVFRAPPSVADAMDAIEAQQRAPYVGWPVCVHNKETGEELRGVIARCWRRGEDPRPVRLLIATERLTLLRMEDSDTRTPWRWCWLTDDVATERRELALRALAAVRATGPKDEAAMWRLFAAEVARLRGAR